MVLDVDEASGDLILKLHCLTVKPGSADICVWADKSWLPKEQIAKTVRPPISGTHLWDCFYVSTIFTSLAHLT